jgi:hypothetical protein
MFLRKQNIFVCVSVCYFLVLRRAQYEMILVPAVGFSLANLLKAVVAFRLHKLLVR